LCFKGTYGYIHTDPSNQVILHRTLEVYSLIQSPSKQLFLNTLLCKLATQAWCFALEFINAKKYMEVIREAMHTSADNV
jgi:hypothetical protein